MDRPDKEREVTAKIDRILTEQPIGMSEAARLFGTYRNTAKTAPQTVYRWCVAGVNLPDGRVVKLEHIRIGSRLLTSRAAIIRFLEDQQTEPDNASKPRATAVRSPAARRRAVENARRKLAAAG